MEAQLTEEKGYYDCPIRICLYGTMDSRVRPGLEQRLKTDKLLTAKAIKEARETNLLQREQERATLGFKSKASTGGLGKKAKV